MRTRLLTGLPSPPTVEEHVLEELVFTRLRLAIDFGELLTFHEDLAASVERALAKARREESQAADLTMRYVRMAWERLGEEVLSQLAEMTLPPPAEEEC